MTPSPIPLSPIPPSSPVQLKFLPGTSGNPHFWEPVAGLLTHRAKRVHALLAAPPPTPDWFAADLQDLSARLGENRAKVLLLWSDADPISPVAVGHRLAALLPSASLHIISGGTHELAVDFAPTVAQLIDHHVAAD